jgi:hypothetical protein
MLRASGFVLLTKLYSGDATSESELGGACHVYGRAEKCIQNFGGETLTKRRRHRWHVEGGRGGFLRSMLRGRRMKSGGVSGCCEHGNEHSGCIKCGEFHGMFCRLASSAMWRVDSDVSKDRNVFIFRVKDEDSTVLRNVWYRSHSITSQKTEILIGTAVRTWNLAILIAYPEGPEEDGENFRLVCARDRDWTGDRVLLTQCVRLHHQISVTPLHSARLQNFAGPNILTAVF